MNVLDLQRMWGDPPAHLTERAAAQSHFNDLCALFGVPAPNDAPSPDYAFERGVVKLTGGKGFADVWRRGWWAWEYKRPGEDLDRAYQQLKLYADALENPPLLVVCDLVRFRIYTNFTGTKTERHDLDVAALDGETARATLRRVFLDPQSFRPGQTKEDVTREAAARFGALAAGIEARGVAPATVAHALMQMLFCLFAEDVRILPAGLFTDLLRLGSRRPAAFAPQATALFRGMATGGVFGVHEIPHVNGGLFAVDVPALTAGELAALWEAAKLDWGAIEPAIFGTLFERSLDPAKRSQLGAHYTGAADIERVVEPVVMAPLRRRWEAVREGWLAGKRTSPTALRKVLDGFRDELAAVRVLDPACGSGNFLYVTLAKLLDLEQAVSAFGAANGLPYALFPAVRPAQMLGLEVNPTARELAQVAVWIGYLQWMLDRGYGWREPVLEPLEMIRLQDALLDRSDPEQPKEAEWPAADFIVGNPPFLGDKKLRSELGDEYVAQLFRVYRGRVPGGADLVCYFFERARAEIEWGNERRAGLLATNSIRGGANRKVLERVKDSGDIFLAWEDQPWVLNGADVRISIVGFDDGSEKERFLNGLPAPAIHANLTSTFDATQSVMLPENAGIGFIGVQPTGPFAVSEVVAQGWLSLPLNVNGRPNSDVLKPFVNATDLVRRDRRQWIIDFGLDMTESDAAAYEAPFEYLRNQVRPTREANRDRRSQHAWWLHHRPRPAMRGAISGLPRFLVSGIVAKHRLFMWLPEGVLPSNKVLAFARADDYFFGVLQSRAHDVWSQHTATRHGVGNDPAYHVERCFETFPLPWPPGREAWKDERLHAVAAAARELDERRRAWLDPPEADAATLKKRTLTNLYNERPTWLAHLHAALDRAVWAAYGWEDEPAATTDEEILARLLELNAERSESQVLKQ